MGGEVKVISEKSDLDELIKSNPGKLIVLDFYATWCGPCKQMAPKFAAMASENDDVIFGKIDVDESEEIAQHYNISAMPTFILLKDGKKVGEMMGANKEKLEGLIKDNK